MAFYSDIANYYPLYVHDGEIMKNNIRVIAFLLVVAWLAKKLAETFVLRWIESKQAKLDKLMAEYGVISREVMK